MFAKSSYKVAVAHSHIGLMIQINQIMGRLHSIKKKKKSYLLSASSFNDLKLISLVLKVFYGHQLMPIIRCVHSLLL